MYTTQLEQIERLVAQTKFNEALNEIKNIEQLPKISKNERLTLNYLKSTLYLKKGLFNDGKQVAEQLLEESREVGNQLREVDALINIIWAYLWLGRLDEGLQLAKRGEKLLKILTVEHQPELKSKKAAFLHFKGLIFIFKGEFEQVLSFLDNCISIREEIGDKRGIAESLFALCIYYFFKRAPDQVLEFGLKNQAISEVLAEKKEIAKSHLPIGWYHRMKGELDKSIEYYKKSQAISEEIDDQEGLIWSLYGIASIYLDKGELNQALEYCLKTLAICEKTGNQLFMASLHTMFGIIYSYKGELDKTLKHYQRSLALHEVFGDLRGIALGLNNIGCVYGEKGDFNSAMNYFERSLHLSRKNDQESLVAETLYQLIRFFVGVLPPETERSYLAELKVINNRHENIPEINQRYRLTEAIVLKARGRLVDKGTAQKIFQQVSEENIVWLELTVEALINLSELLLVELETTGNESVFNELNELSHRLLTIAKNQYAHLYVAEAYLIQSKLKLLELNLPEARHLLTQAHIIAQEKGLNRLERIISVEGDSLDKHLDTWEKIIDQKPSMSEIIKLTQVGELITGMLHKKQFQNEEELLAYAEMASQLVQAWEKT